MALMSAATLITVAPTGAEAHKQAHPALPVALEELVAGAISCQDAGAAMIHIHYGPKRPAKGNTELVERAARLAAEAFRPAATVDQARRLRSLPTQG